MIKNGHIGTCPEMGHFFGAAKSWSGKILERQNLERGNLERENLDREKFGAAKSWSGKNLERGNSFL